LKKFIIDVNKFAISASAAVIISLLDFSKAPLIE